MKLALFSAGSGAKTKKATRRWRAHLPLVRPLAFLLLPLALRASPIITVDQITAYFCDQIPSCYDYPVLPPALPPIMEAPGYTLGPYIGYEKNYRKKGTPS